MISPFESALERHSSRPRRAPVAKVLLADADPASRLSLKTLLVTAGYAVDGAISSTEALLRLDDNEYQLVLADLRRESEDAGARVLAYARQKNYRPATALINSELYETARLDGAETPHSRVHISDEDVSDLLGNVAELISDRASRRMRRMAMAAVC